MHNQFNPADHSWCSADTLQRLEREERYRDAVAVFEEYRRTGLHVTEEEADVWMARLESGDDAVASYPISHT